MFSKLLRKLVAKDDARIAGLVEKQLTEVNAYITSQHYYMAQAGHGQSAVSGLLGIILQGTKEEMRAAAAINLASLALKSGAKVNALQSFTSVISQVLNEATKDFPQASVLADQFNQNGEITNANAQSAIREVDPFLTSVLAHNLIQKALA